MKCRFLPLILLPLLMGGCGLYDRFFGARMAPPGMTSAGEYSGLAHKSVAIVVYVPRATLDEYVGTREEVSSFIVASMRAHLPTTELVSPRDVINFQDDTLNWTALSERDLARHFSVDKVLFVEVLDYSTHKVVGLSNMQGHLRAMCHITDSGADAGNSPEWKGVIDARWPSDRALDPTQNNDTAVRLRVLASFADRLVRCFYAGGAIGPDMPG